MDEKQEVPTIGIKRRVIQSHIENGVMVMKDGKAWGITYEDGQCTCEGWTDPISAPISDTRYCTSPTSITYMSMDNSDKKELLTGKIVKVERKTTIAIVE
ncbi:MAG: hypothetical protein ACTSYW_00565 [Candidatus Heimdallarchaeota archaeon]